MPTSRQYCSCPPRRYRPQTPRVEVLYEAHQYPSCRGIRCTVADRFFRHAPRRESVPVYEASLGPETLARLVALVTTTARTRSGLSFPVRHKAAAGHFRCGENTPEFGRKK